MNDGKGLSSKQASKQAMKDQEQQQRTKHELNKQ